MTGLDQGAVGAEPEATTKGLSDALLALWEFWDYWHNKAGFVDVDEPSIISGIVAEDSFEFDRLSDVVEANLPTILDALNGPLSGSPTPTHVDTVSGPAAAVLAGGVVVSDEAVEAAARADHAFGRLGDDPDWDGLSNVDRHSYRRAARSYLIAAAPLIAAQALRSVAGEIRRELVCCDVYERAYGHAMAVRGVERYGHAICFWSEASARINEARADELEQGADR